MENHSYQRNTKSLESNTAGWLLTNILPSDYTKNSRENFSTPNSTFHQSIRNWQQYQYGYRKNHLAATSLSKYATEWNAVS